MELLYQMFPIALMCATPLILGALGGLFSERSGIVNIAVDGTMQIGGFVAAAILVVGVEAGWGGASKWIALVASMVAGVVFIALHGIASIHFRADQTISGTALNVLAGGLTIFLCEVFYGLQQTPFFTPEASFKKVTVPFLSEIPIIGPMLFTDVYSLTFIAFILVFITWFIMKKTAFGLRLRSCGEFPQASASMGINVVKMRWIALIISGALSGLAGAALVMTTSNYYYVSSIHGLGFVAIATLIFGQWNAFGVLGAGIFFGFAQTLGYFSSSISIFSSLPSEFFALFPYVVTIIALIIFSGRAVGPKASGEIYDSGKR